VNGYHLIYHDIVVIPWYRNGTTMVTGGELHNLKKKIKMHFEKYHGSY